MVHVVQLLVASQSAEDHYLQLCSVLMQWSLVVATITEIPPLLFLPNFLVQRKVLRPLRTQTGGTIMVDIWLPLFFFVIVVSWLIAFFLHPYLLENEITNKNIYSLTYDCTHCRCITVHSSPELEVNILTHVVYLKQGYWFLASLKLTL